jgi:hypothetical protein
VSAFDTASINKSIATTLAAAGAPADHTKAFIVTGEAGSDGSSVKAVYVQKVGHGWAVAGEFELASSGDKSARAGAIWTGK